VLDIDDANLADPICRALQNIWPEIWQYVAVVETPRPGRQLLCRLSEPPPGNQRFAHRQQDDGSIRAVVESRGAGGFVIAVGSPASVHPSGRPYRHIFGAAIEHLQPIAQRHFNRILTVARLFNEVEIDQGLFLDEVEARDIEWLWHDFLATGELHLYSAEQGLGKSFATLDLVARVTKGSDWPDGSVDRNVLERV
jgi:hypothetical protein